MWMPGIKQGMSEKSFGRNGYVTRCVGHGRHPRDRGGHLEGVEGGRLQGRSQSTAATTRRRQKFKSETGIAVFKWDVSSFDACADGVKKVEAELGPIEVLINNAGITRDAMLHRMKPEQWTAVITTNLGSLFNMCRQVIGGHARAQVRPHRSTSRRSTARRARWGRANYSAAKAGEIGFTKALAQEGARAGITVNAICPGYINTEMVQAVPKDVLEKNILPQIPIGRLGEPEEIARCVVFLASDEAGLITGSTLSANGGQYFA